MIFLLLIVYQIKHFLCDYPLQGKYMLGKFKPYPAFIMPLLAHSAVHGVATFGIAVMFKSWKMSLFLGLLDMGIHFLVDRIKASPSMLGRFKALDKNGYMSAYNMSIGLTMVGGKPLKEVHGQMDDGAIKEYVEIGKKDLRSNTYFWWALGADQMAHHLTHYLIIWMLL